MKRKPHKLMMQFNNIQDYKNRCMFLKSCLNLYNTILINNLYNCCLCSKHTLNKKYHMEDMLHLSIHSSLHHSCFNMFLRQDYSRMKLKHSLYIDLMKDQYMQNIKNNKPNNPLVMNYNILMDNLLNKFLMPKYKKHHHYRMYMMYLQNRNK